MYNTFPPAIQPTDHYANILPSHLLLNLKMTNLIMKIMMMMIIMIMMVTALKTDGKI